MITSYSIAFPSPELTMLLPGEVLIEESLSDGIIKTMAVEETEESKLSISKVSIGNIVIKLADETPFHAALLIPEHADGVLTNDRTQIFQQPIDELRLESVKMPSGEEYWRASGVQLSNDESPKMIKLVWTATN